MITKVNKEMSDSSSVEGTTIANRHFSITRVNGYQLPQEAQLPPSLTTGRVEKRKEISIDIIGMLHQLASTVHAPEICISSVHHELRSVNEKAYRPVLLSIGPYHYDKRKSDLQFMEQHKLRYLGDLIKRREQKESISESDQLGQYLGVLEKMEDRARSYYAEPITLEKDAFIKMLLLDGCFIIELFRKAAWKDFQHDRETDPLFKIRWIIATLKRDLILFENQIPFFILEGLYSIIGDIRDPLALIFMAVSYLPIYKYLPRGQRADECAIDRKSIADLATDLFVELPPTLQSRRLDRDKLNDIKHLLDLVRKFMMIEETLEIKDESALPLNQGLQELKKSTSPGSTKYTYSAMELRELGVRFEGVKKRKFYEIAFENGVLEIPIIKIEDRTEVRFRNLIAYEEHGHCDGEKVYIGDYISFMNGLINNAKDVELLRCHGILESLLGDDEQIAVMFNKLAKNKTLMSYYYAGILHKLAEHCKKRRNKWMEKLRRNYLNSPWTIISVIAAAVLLILTITQTVYSALSYYNA